MINKNSLLMMFLMCMSFAGAILEATAKKIARKKTIQKTSHMHTSYPIKKGKDPAARYINLWNAALSQLNTTKAPFPVALGNNGAETYKSLVPITSSDKEFSALIQLIINNNPQTFQFVFSNFSVARRTALRQMEASVGGGGKKTLVDFANLFKRKTIEAMLK